MGAEIIGVDCGGDLDAATIAAIERAWHENLAIVFRNQRLDDSGLMAFTRRFGELDLAPCPNQLTLSTCRRQSEMRRFK